MPAKDFALTIILPTVLPAVWLRGHQPDPPASPGMERPRLAVSAGHQSPLRLRWPGRCLLPQPGRTAPRSARSPSGAPSPGTGTVSGGW